MRPALNIAISGGGIAGFTAALALAQHSHRVTVFERATALTDIGAGIQLSPNAGKVLSVLGLENAVTAISFEPDILQLVNGKTGQTLSTLPFKSLMQQSYHGAYLVAHRGDLQAVLMAAANQQPHISIQTGIDIRAFEQGLGNVTVAGQKFDLLIAADGINSSLRAHIDPAARNKASVQTAWRATLPIEIAEARQNAVSVYMNAGAHLVAYKMGQRPELNVVFVSESQTPPSAANFGGLAKQLLSAAQNWKAWPLASVHSAVWHKGSALMIGDAAHAMTPHAAQGGAMAIEDALVLANCIATASTVEAALRDFQDKRVPRIEAVRALSAQNRAVYQMGGLMAAGRNLTMPVVPPALLLRRLDWLYGWQA